MRIGFFGGTFDPPHRAHLSLACAAADAFALDRVLLAPTGVQPLKQYAPGATFQDRVAMTRLLCADDARLETSDIDAPHEDGSPNFTVNTLAAVQRQYPAASLFVLVGADSFLTLPYWREPARLLELAEWIVVSRPGFSLDDLSALQLTASQEARVHLLKTLEEDVSASGIRERLRIGVSCGTTLTPTVALYIARMHLYHAR
ncbi:MAG: nicotinate (nicotinamide) nucleotide adenylyltransferase [Janthinobacterium lividum]